MLICGGKNRNKKLSQMNEVAISCSIEELDNIIEFLIYAKEELIKEKDLRLKDSYNNENSIIMPHCHYQYWDKNWKKEAPDIIVISPCRANFNDIGELEWIDMTLEELKELENEEINGRR